MRTKAKQKPTKNSEKPMTNNEKPMNKQEKPLKNISISMNTNEYGRYSSDKSGLWHVDSVVWLEGTPERWRANMGLYSRWRANTKVLRSTEFLQGPYKSLIRTL